MEISFEIITRMLYALGIGVLIGLERSMETQRPSTPLLPKENNLKDEAIGEEEPTDEASQAGDKKRSRTTPEENAPESIEQMGEQMGGGIHGSIHEYIGTRTFTILSLFGFSAAFIGGSAPFAVPAALLIAGALVIAMYFRAEDAGVGITTEIAAITTCGLGALAFSHPQEAGILGLILTMLLASKRIAHHLSAQIRWVELTDTLKFLVIIFILLPLMPNRALDPYGAFNPYKVTFLVILISGIGYVGYFLIRLLGARRGLGLTGLVGGLTSSTAVTAAMAAQARKEPSLRAPCAFATVGANATMFVRVLVVVALIDWDLMLRLSWSIGTMAIIAIGISALLWIASGKQKEEASAEVALQNPFSLGPALKFAAFFIVILLISRLATQFFGNQGLYLAATVSGLADVDAITLSIAEQTSGGDLARKVGAIAITIAVTSNSVVKSGIAWYSGGKSFGMLITACLLVATGSGLIVAFLI